MGFSDHWAGKRFRAGHEGWPQEVNWGELSKKGDVGLGRERPPRLRRVTSLLGRSQGLATAQAQEQGPQSQADPRPGGGEVQGLRSSLPASLHSSWPPGPPQPRGALLEQNAAPGPLWPPSLARGPRPLPSRPQAALHLGPPTPAQDSSLQPPLLLTHTTSPSPDLRRPPPATRRPNSSQVPGRASTRLGLLADARVSVWPICTS